MLLYKIMCCGQKVHHDAMAILREQITKSMAQRPTIGHIQPEAMKQRVLQTKEINKQRYIVNKTK